MDNKFYCVSCGCSLRKINKELEYLGIVCSICYRMSNKKYHELVDILSKKKIEFILKEIEKTKIFNNLSNH